MTGKAKLTTIMLAAALAAVLAYARPGLAQDIKSDREKIQSNIAKLNNPETTEVAEKQREFAAGSLLDCAAKYPEALSALKAALDYGNNPEPTSNIVIAVLNALTYKDEIGIPADLVPYVINRLGDNDQAISAQAEKALTTASARKSDNIYSALVKALHNEKRPEKIRAHAAHIIAESGRKEACQALIEALGTGGLSEGAVVEIIRALGEIGDKQAVPTLIDLLDSDSMSVRKKAAQSLRRITFYDFGVNRAEWEKWWAKNKDKSRAKWQEEFVLALQKDRADEMIADLKTVTPDTALNTVMKVLRKPAGSLITPHDRYGVRYAEVIRHVVDAIIKNPLKAAEYDQIAPHLEALLASDDEKIRDAVLNYFTSEKPGIPHSASSIAPLLACYRNPAESDQIKDRALKALKLSVGAVDAAKMAPELRAELVSAMEQTACSASYLRRGLAVDILGAGLKHVDGLMVLVRLLKFDEAPSNEDADVELRKRIAFTMVPVLETNGRLKLSDKNKAEIAAILARTFVLDLKVADKIAVPLAYVGYEGEITVGERKFAGVSGLLASRLEETVEWGFDKDAKPEDVARTVRDIREGVLKAFAKLKNGSTADNIITALKNPKVIDSEEKVGPNDSTLCETALSTLGSVGGREAAEYLLASELLNSANPKIKEQAWKSLRDVVKRIFDAGSYEYLIGKEAALDTAEAAAKPVSNAKSACDAARAILQDAKKALADAVAAVKARIKELDPADKAKLEAAKAFVEAEIARNKVAILAELVEALNPAAANPKPVTDAVRAILAARLNVPEGQDINTMTYEQIKKLSAK